MKTKQDIQLELLQELDEICKDNNLKYFLIGLNSLNAYLNNTIRNASRIVAVGMVQTDIDKFCQIIEKQNNSNRYVEGIFNNPNFLPVYVTYGNTNTTDFHMVALNRNIHHGIHIRLYPIFKAETLDGEPIVGWDSRLSKEREFRKFSSKRIENKKFWYMKAGFGALNFAYKITGGAKRYYNNVKRNIAIDKWEDIQNYSKVRFINKTVSSKHFLDFQRVEVDGIEVNLLKDSDALFSEIYGEDFKEIKIKPKPPRKRAIVDTEIGYEQILSETQSILTEIRSTHEELVWGRRKVSHEKETVKKVWNLVKMTGKELEYEEFFEENIDRLLTYDLDDEQEFEELYDELEPVIRSLNRYSKYGMTFPIEPKSMDLIKRVLVKLEKEDLINRIEKISKKKYFVE